MNGSSCKHAKVGVGVLSSVLPMSCLQLVVDAIEANRWNTITYNGTTSLQSQVLNGQYISRAVALATLDIVLKKFLTSVKPDSVLFQLHECALIVT